MNNGIQRRKRQIKKCTRHIQSYYYVHV